MQLYAYPSHVPPVVWHRTWCALHSTVIHSMLCVESGWDYGRWQRRHVRNASIHLHWQSSESGQDGCRPPSRCWQSMYICRQFTYLFNYCPSVFWHCWLGHLTNIVFCGTLNPTQSNPTYLFISVWWGIQSSRRWQCVYFSAVYLLVHSSMIWHLGL